MRLHRSNAHWQAGDGKRALLDAVISIKYTPNLGMAYIRKGDALLLLNLVDLALEAYREGVRIDPDNTRCTTGVNRTSVD